MKKHDFDRCTTEATKLLHFQDVSNRILNIQTLNYDKNIIFDSIQNYSLLTGRPLSDFLSKKRRMLYDGCTICAPDGSYYIVLYNAGTRHFEHRNWTLAHEIGHIYLNHEKDSDLEEVEAHFFASQLFMPEYSLFMMSHQYGRIAVQDLVEIFGVSATAAAKRIKTMNKKTLFHAGRRDKEIWEIQKEKVDMYYECKKEGSDFRNTLNFWSEMKADYERECRLEAYSQMRY